jgi:HK97 gp10 family phage protein
MAVESLTFKAEGFKELEDLLVEMGEDLCYGKTASRVLIPAVKAAMQPVLDTARQMAPYDETNNTSKHLRDTLRLNVRVPTPRDQKSIYIEKDDIVMGLVSVRTDKRGISQEFGNAAVAAQPYLRPALQSQAAKVISILGTFLTYKLNQYKSKKV